MAEAAEAEAEAEAPLLEALSAAASGWRALVQASVFQPATHSDVKRKYRASVLTWDAVSHPPWRSRAQQIDMVFANLEAVAFQELSLIFLL